MRSVLAHFINRELKHCDPLVMRLLRGTTKSARPTPFLHQTTCHLEVPENGKIASSSTSQDLAYSRTPNLCWVDVPGYQLNGNSEILGRH